MGMRFRQGVLRGFAAGCLAVASLCASAAEVLEIRGAVAQPLRLDLAALAARPGEVLRVQGERGASGDYRCLRLHALLREAGVVEGKALSGAHLTDFVLAAAPEGYTALFSLAELDPLLGNIRAWVCYQRDGQPLADEEGPLRLVVEGEQRHARWVRHLGSVEVRELPAR